MSMQAKLPVNSFQNKEPSEPLIKALTECFKLLKDDDENRLGRLFQLRWKQNDFVILKIKNAEPNSFNKAKINTLLRRIVDFFYLQALQRKRHRTHKQAWTGPA